MSKKDSGAIQLASVPNWPPTSILESGRIYRPVVGVDVHQTVTDFWKEFGAWLEQLYPGVKIDPATLKTYHPAGDPACKIGFREFENALNQFVQLAVGGYGSFPALPGAVEGINAIRKAGVEVEFLTFVPGASDLQPTDQLPFNTGVARRVTVKLLQAQGFGVSERDVTFITPFKKAYHMIEHQIPLLVEDNRTTASHVADMGLAALLLPTPYNVCSMPNVLRLEEREDKAAIWAEAAGRIIQFYLALAQHGKLTLEGGR